MVPRLIFAAVIATFLTGCQTTGKGDFCDIAKPIRLTSEQIDKLSDAQVKELLAFNEKGSRLCGW